MRIYFGLDGKTAFVRLETVLHQYVLDTFWEPIDRKWHTAYKGIFLDSGAYSAWQKGESIDREAYADYALSGDFDVIAGDLKIENASPDQTLTDTEYTTDWLYKCFWRICDEEGRPKAKVHGFRFTSRIQDFPFWSVDSTSWVQSNGVSMISLGRELPWLRPLEIGELVMKYYARLPRCTRLTEPKQTELF
jgi:hypothetical protein